MATALTDCQNQPIVVSSRPVVVVLTPAAGRDTRDVLDHGLSATDPRRPDVVVTRDPDAIEYAERKSEYLVVALPWDRTYVLASKDSVGSLSYADRSALARDAVRGEARGETRYYPVAGDSTCNVPQTMTVVPAPVVAFAAGDDMARQLAERIIALAGSSRRPDWIPRSLGHAPRLLPLATDSVEAAVASGRAAAGVISITTDSLLGCYTYSLNTLVDSRPTAIVRRGSGAAFIIGSDASLTFTKRGAP